MTLALLASAEFSGQNFHYSDDPEGGQRVEGMQAALAALDSEQSPGYD